MLVEATVPVNHDARLLTCRGRRVASIDDMLDMY